MIEQLNRIEAALRAHQDVGGDTCGCPACQLTPDALTAVEQVSAELSRLEYKVERLNFLVAELDFGAGGALSSLECSKSENTRLRAKLASLRNTANSYRQTTEKLLGIEIPKSEPELEFALCQMREIHRLRAENAELRKDKALLDWLDSGGVWRMEKRFDTSLGADWPVFFKPTFGYESYGHNTAREAIKAAMKGVY